MNPNHSEHNVLMGNTNPTLRQSAEMGNGRESGRACRDGLVRSELDVHRLLEVLPAAAYTTDSEGLITDFNRRAVEYWGREPKRNDPQDRY